MCVVLEVLLKICRQVFIGTASLKEFRDVKFYWKWAFIIIASWYSTLSTEHLTLSSLPSNLCPRQWSEFDMWDRKAWKENGGIVGDCHSSRRENWSHILTPCFECRSPSRESGDKHVDDANYGSRNLISAKVSGQNDVKAGRNTDHSTYMNGH